MTLLEESGLVNTGIGSALTSVYDFAFICVRILISSVMLLRFEVVMALLEVLLLFRKRYGLLRSHSLYLKIQRKDSNLDS